MSDPFVNTGVGTRQTPQSQPIPGRTDQVENSAGGYVFQVDDWDRLRRFLVLGTQGGTYYIREQELTRENAGMLLALIEQDGVRVVNELVKVSTENLAPRVQPTIFALAACAGSDDSQTRAAALDALPVICRTGYHLFKFAAYVEQFRGWGRGLKNAIRGWYENRPLDNLQLQVVKYKQREGWSHADLLRLAKPEPERGGDVDRVFGWVVGKPHEGAQLEFLAAADEVQKTTDPKRIAELVTEHNLPWEALPGESLRSKVVWEALLPRMGYTALIRQLARLSNIGLLTEMSDAAATVVRRLSDAEAIRKARVHPFAVLLAMSTYAAGRGVKGDMTWTPVRTVVDALDGAFYGAFGNVEPSGKRIMVALDVSGSMGTPILNTHLAARTASAAMALITVATEPNTMATAFSSPDGYGYGYSRRHGGNPDEGIRGITLSARQRLDNVIRDTDRLPFGGTDCALPMLYAAKHNYDLDAFVIYTDSETWFGDIHPSQALVNYRQKVGHDAKLIVVGMTSTGFTIADPKDPGMLDVVGFDASAPATISDFTAGRI